MKNIAQSIGALAAIAVFLLAGYSVAQQPTRFWVKRGDEVKHDEVAPHDGSGMTTAYRYFDEVKDATLIFRKRSMPRGSFIGKHVLDHDEVYYVESGEAELDVDGLKRTLSSNGAAYMKKGADVAIHQRGEKSLGKLCTGYTARDGASHFQSNMA